MEMEIEPMIEEPPEPVKEPPKVKKKPEKPNFMISSHWDGERSPDTCLKVGTKGVGYYRDRPSMYLLVTMKSCHTVHKRVL